MKEKLLDNFVVYMLVAVALIIVGSIVGGLIVGIPIGQYAISIIDDPMLLADPDAYSEVIAQLPPLVLIADGYLSFIGIWIVTLLWFLKKNNRPLYRTITTYTRGNTVSKLFLGLLLGFALNGFCVLVAYLHGDIELTFYGIEPQILIPAFLMVFIQSSAEELICRGYLYQKLLKKYQKPVIAIVGNSALFFIMHILNDGVTILSLVNIFLVGIVFSLIVYYLDSLWAAFAAHAAWNFTQNILFGLPNSGADSPYGVFVLKASTAKNSFAYNTGFGVEGTVLVAIVLLVAGIALYCIGKKKQWKPTDIWE